MTYVIVLYFCTLYQYQNLSMVDIFNDSDCDNCTDCDIRSPVFGVLTNEEKYLLNKDRYIVKYKPGELIYKQGSSYTHVISLTSGLVKLYIEGSQKELITRICRPVEFIGGSGMYIDNKHHNSAAAVSNVSVCYIEVNQFKDIVRKNAMFAEELIKMISTRRLYSFERLGSFMQKQMTGRIAEAILYLSEQIFQMGKFDMILSRQDLANFCGVTKEGLIRTLKEFKEAGLISLDGTYLEILDNKTLKKVSLHG